MKLFSYIVLFLSAATLAQARLGETEKQLVERFGAPGSRSRHSIIAQGRIWELGPTLNFKQNDWQISCDLVDERVVRIQYQKVGEWTEDQIQAVLNSNSQGDKW